jgi:dTDP-glucose 4,6-dehydratase
LALAYTATYGLAVNITRGSNTFGPRQYPEKLVPLFVTNALEDLPLPVYGDGQQVRDWLYVDDHCAGIEFVLSQGQPGEIYNVGGGNPLSNLRLTQEILDLLDKPMDLIRYVPDRPGHDRRYALDTSKLRSLGWQPTHDFDEALAGTVAWYSDHAGWWQRLKSGEYADYYRRQYEARLAAGPASVARLA